MTEGDFILENVRLNGVYDNAGAEAKVGNMIDIDAAAVIGTIGLRNSEIYGYANRLVSGSGESSVDELVVAGNLVHDFGTSGDFIDFRKGSLGHVNIQNNTFWNGIRTFLRVDAAVNNGGVLVENNTFYNLCAVDNKDNNGIMHVRSSSAVAPASLGSAARRVLVRKNIFAAMHKAAETPSQANGFPKLVSSASEKIKISPKENPPVLFASCGSMHARPTMSSSAVNEKMPHDVPKGVVVGEATLVPSL